MTKNQTILFLLFRKLGQTWQLFPAFLFLGFFFVYPVVLLLSLSFLNSNGEITLIRIVFRLGVEGNRERAVDVHGGIGGDH